MSWLLSELKKKSLAGILHFCQVHVLRYGIFQFKIFFISFDGHKNAWLESVDNASSVFLELREKY